MNNNELNNNCSFHLTEMNNKTEKVNLDDVTESELGEWEILFRLESVEDLEKLFSPNKKVNENLGELK
ncbi:MAG: hypothetical protein U5K55_14745 [Aliarcobacter sp.]|nr:hypothetical protein [Aliarcobacter sp.]